MCTKENYKHIFMELIQLFKYNIHETLNNVFSYTESSKYYTRPQTAVARDLGWLNRRLTGLHTAVARKHSLCFSVTVIPVIL